MIRSFHYAAHVALGEEVERGRIAPDPEAQAPLRPWVRFWQAWVSATFLRSYLNAVRELRAELLPADDDGVRALLESWILEKALYEVRYELNSRPDWVSIPLSGVLEVLDATKS
jgi:maltose alpha-D-glucosyltransferase/alpha-amylase